MEIPTFRFHPDPISTGAIEASDKECICCGESRGFIYKGPVYAEDELHECLCPWCISDGCAQNKYEAQFADDYNLFDADIDKDIIDEVVCRTPGYISWQGNIWLIHCRQPCEFHGDAEKADLEQLDEEQKVNLCTDSAFSLKDWDNIIATYQKAGQPAFYKFICTVCRKPLFHVDYT